MKGGAEHRAAHAAYPARWRRSALAAATLSLTSLVLMPPTTLAAAAAPGTISTFAGGGTPANVGVAPTAASVRPNQLAVDGAHNLFIASGPENRVAKVSPGADGVIGGPNDTGPTNDDLITTLAGSGTAGFAGDGAPASVAQLNNPTGVAVDSAGNVYVADNGNNRVRFVCEQTACTTAAAALTAGQIATIAGNGTNTEESGKSGDGLPATAASVDAPSAVALDNAGNLYIADDWCAASGCLNGTIRFVCLAALTCSTWAGSVNQGDIITVEGTATTEGSRNENVPATLAFSQGSAGLSVDSAGNLFESENNSRIREVCGQTTNCNIAGKGVTYGWVVTIASAGANSPLALPQQITTTGSGASFALEVADRSANQVYGYNLSRQAYTTMAGTGTAGYTGDAGAATSAQLNGPSGVAMDGTTMFIGDSVNNVVRKVDGSGMITTVAGDGGTVPTGDGSPATSARIAAPIGVARDAAGNTYISDNVGQRIRKVNPSGIISTVAGNGTFCRGGGGCGDGGPATSAQLGPGPQDIARDAAGNVYIADQELSRIRFVCLQSGTCRTPFGSVPSGFITSVAGGGTPGSGIGDGGLATQASLDNPYDVALDAAGNLYIADSFNHRARFVCMQLFASCVTPFGAVAPGNISTVAGNGVPQYAGDGGPATSASLFNIYSIAAGNGGLYISDGITNIRFVCLQLTLCGTPFSNVPGVANGALASGFITTIAGGQQVNGCVYSSSTTCGDGGPATAAGFNQPRVSTDPAGNVYVADTRNQRIRFICMQTACPTFLSSTPMAQGAIVTLAGSGNGSTGSVPGGFSGDGAAATSAQFHDPYPPAFDTAGNMYIPDLNNGRVREVAAPVTLQPYPVPLYPSFAGQQVGTVSATQAVTLSNPTSSGISVSSVAISGSNAADFFIATDTCSGHSVAPGAICSVGVGFMPTGFGRRQATLTFNDNGPTTSQTAGLVGLADSTKVGVVGANSCAPTAPCGSLYAKQDAQPYRNLSGSIAATPMVLSVPGPAGASPMVLYIGLGTDSNLYVRSDTQAWQAFAPPGTSCLDSPGATVTPASGGAYTLTVACQGSDHALYYAQVAVTAGTLPSIGSGGWAYLGGTLNAGPAVTALNGQITFIVTGGGGQLWQRGVSTGYTPINGGCLNHVAVASNPSGTSAYLACHGSDNGLWLSVNAGAGWGGFLNLGGLVQQSPAIAVTSTQVTIWVEGSDTALYHRTTSLQGTNPSAYVFDGGSVQFGAGGAGMIAS